MNDQRLSTSTTADVDISPLDLQAMRRAAEIGIDPRRVAIALGIPLARLNGLRLDGRPLAATTDSPG